MMAFLVSSPLGNGEVYANDDPSAKITEMQRTINAQAVEIKQLKREQARLQVNVDQGWAIVRTQEKEADELKKRVANLEKELRDCRGGNR
jgi:peptidoglycan hydrolase CwlO-like protein